MDLLHLAWKNLWRNRRRTLITMAALSCSLTLMHAFHNLAMGSYQQMIDSGVRAGSGHVAVYRGDYLHSRDEALTFPAAPVIVKADAIPTVREALPRVYLPALAQSSRESRGILLMGIDPQKEAAVNPYFKNLTAAQNLPSLTGREALMGERLMKELKLGLGKKFVVTIQTRDGEIFSELFRIHAAIHTGLKQVDKGLIMVGWKRAAAMAGTPGQINELALVLTAADDVAAVRDAMNRQLKDQPDLAAYGWDEAMPNMANAIKLDYTSQKFIFVIILLIVTIGVINTLLMSVMERMREFGIILALGSGAGFLRRLVLTEGLILGIISMLIGHIFGALVTWYLVDKGIDLRAWVSQDLEFGGVVFDPVLHAAWDLPWMFWIGWFMVGLTLLASFYPAVKAARIMPVEAIHQS